MPWVPGAERHYNEGVNPIGLTSLASEYINFSVPSSAKFEEPYPRNAVYHDVVSDSLLAYPKLQNYADNVTGYYATVLAKTQAPETTAPK